MCVKDGEEGEKTGIELHKCVNSVGPSGRFMVTFFLNVVHEEYQFLKGKTIRWVGCLVR